MHGVLFHLLFVLLILPSAFEAELNEAPIMAEAPRREILYEVFHK